jgi:hypothetical protein
MFTEVRFLDGDDVVLFYIPTKMAGPVTAFAFVYIPIQQADVFRIKRVD